MVKFIIVLSISVLVKCEVDLLESLFATFWAIILIGIVCAIFDAIATITRIDAITVIALELFGTTTSYNYFVQFG